ncbi:MAG: ATP-binding protein, partial [Lentisphaerota bacterium]
LKTIDLDATISDLNEMLRRIVPSKICMEIIPHPDLWKIKADPGNIEQIMMNLVSNAADAMPTGGKLTVKTENVKIDEPKRLLDHSDIKPGAYVVLSVNDTGCGMDASVKEHIFEPFFTTKEVGKGAGLGLATVYGIVKQSNAHIDVQSEPGKGAKSLIYFPKFVNENTADDATDDMENMPRGSETILLAEDEDSMRDMLQAFLHLIGYAVIAASNGEEALELAGNHKGQIHILLTDIVMPKMNGFQLAKHAEELFPGIKLLFMSSYARPADSDNRMDISDNFIEKPINMHALAVKIHKILGGKGH